MPEPCEPPVRIETDVARHAVVRRMSWPGAVGAAAHVELPPVSENDRTFRPAVVGTAKQARPPRGVPR